MPDREQQWRPFVRVDVAISLGLAAVTIGGWMLGALQDVPWLFRIPAILLTLCTLAFLYDRYSEHALRLIGGLPKPSPGDPTLTDASLAGGLRQVIGGVLGSLSHS